VRYAPTQNSIVYPDGPYLPPFLRAALPLATRNATPIPALEVDGLIEPPTPTPGAFVFARSVRHVDEETLVSARNVHSTSTRAWSNSVVSTAPPRRKPVIVLCAFDPTTGQKTRQDAKNGPFLAFPKVVYFPNPNTVCRCKTVPLFFSMDILINGSKKKRRSSPTLETSKTRRSAKTRSEKSTSSALGPSHSDPRSPEVHVYPRQCVLVAYRCSCLRPPFSG